MAMRYFKLVFQIVIFTELQFFFFLTIFGLFCSRISRRDWYFNCLLILLGVLGALVGLWDTINRMSQDSVVNRDELSHSLSIATPIDNATGDVLQSTLFLKTPSQMEEVFSPSISVNVSNQYPANISIEKPAVNLLFPVNGSGNQVNLTAPVKKADVSKGLPISKANVSQILPDARANVGQILPDAKANVSQILPDAKANVSQILPDAKTNVSQILPDANSVASKSTKETAR